MWLTSFRLLAFLRKGLGQFPIAQNTVPYNPTRLDRGQNQDIASADVAMENSALDNGKLVACQCITTIVSKCRKGAQRRKGAPVMQYQITCVSCLLDLISVDGRQTSATTMR